MQREIQDGSLVDDFGGRAERLIASVARAGPGGAGLARALDAALEVMYQRQLVLLREQLVRTHSKAERPLAALQQADSEFVQRAASLERPGGAWNSGPERSSLVRALGDGYRRDAELAEGQASGALLQRQLVGEIRALQKDIDNLSKAQPARRSSPWIIVSSWRIPKTPLQLVGAYNQGRVDVGLVLSPETDPTSSRGGLRPGVGPATVGASFDVGG